MDADLLDQQRYLSNHFLAWMMTCALVIVAIVVTAISGAENLSRTSIRIQE
jgi:hypothetical protein